jgi:NAD-dependent deacetylase
VGAGTMSSAGGEKLRNPMDSKLTGRLIVFSGAGLSAESGLSTFRNAPSGLWENYSPEILCDYRTWKRNFEKVHEFYDMRRTQLTAVEPNSAHRQIAQWQTRYNTVLFTQNVDDLLERAGCSDVVHLHGFLTDMECEACGNAWSIGYVAFGPQGRCPRCNSRRGVKPGVVMFHQAAPRYRDLYTVLDELRFRDVIVVTGTSETVIEIGEHLSARPGYKIFNALEASATSSYDESFIMQATAAFPAIDKVLAVRLGSRLIA